MRALVVVVAHVRPERGRASNGARIRPTIGPFPQQRLDKALRFSVGARGVRPRSFVADLPNATGAREEARTVAAAIVREDPADADAASSKPLEGPPQERVTRPPTLRATDFDISQAGGIVNGHVRVFPAAAARLGMHLRAEEPMPDASNATERFDIQMEEIAGMGPFIALNQRARLEQPQPIQPDSGQHAGDRRTWHAKPGTDLPARCTGVAERHDLRGRRHR